jgi:hypothetical protein
MKGIKLFVFSFFLFLSTYASDIVSIKSGNWSDPLTWGGVVPSINDKAIINVGHTVVLNTNVSIAGININGFLTFDPNQNITITSTKNIIVNGIWTMIPNNINIIHLVKMSGINEDVFGGGGEDPLETDIGIWVMGDGKLNWQGVNKTSWLNAESSITIDTFLTVKDIPNNWKTGDELAITPTSAGSLAFDNVSIKSITNQNIILNSFIENVHPKINNKWTAEVMNLTRNVRIEGTQTGKSHIFIRSNKPQIVKYVQFRYLGPRNQQAGDEAKEFVLGRYGIHFHHCKDSSRGSIVEGCVMRDVDNHAYVTHGSHGVSFRDNIAYNVTETPFWWDEGKAHESNNITWVHNIVALVKYVPRSINVGNPYGDPTLSSRGYLLGHGDDNICDSNVVVANQGDERDGGGFKWEAVSNDSPEGVWHFSNNLAHNCTSGIIVWQNVQTNHHIKNFIGYNNLIGIFHGAYVNNYKYSNIELFNNPLIIHAGSSNPSRLRFEDVVVNANGQDYAVIIEGNSEVAPTPILIRNLITSNYNIASVIDASSQTKHSADIIQSNGVFIMHSTANQNEVLRIQPISGQATKITPAGTTNIANFAPTIWGNGLGLKGEYFKNTNFTSKAFERIDPTLAFSEWANGVHNLIKTDTYSVRWSGFIQAQFTETHTLITNPTGVKIWVNGNLIVNNSSTGNINLEAGVKYPIQIEYSKTNPARSGFIFGWVSNSINNFTPGGEYVPQSQLYTETVNIQPVANTNNDTSLIISYTLDGSTSFDTDGTIAVYIWTKISGPSVNIISPNSAITKITDLKPGTYVFELKVIDNQGASNTKNVTITVNY